MAGDEDPAGALRMRGRAPNSEWACAGAASKAGHRLRLPTARPYKREGPQLGNRGPVNGKHINSAICIGRSTFAWNGGHPQCRSTLSC